MGDGEYPRTNDAVLYSYELDSEAGAYIVYLDFLCNGGLILREKVASIAFDGTVTYEPHVLRTYHPAIYTTPEIVVTMSSNLKEAKRE